MITALTLFLGLVASLPASAQDELTKDPGPGQTVEVRHDEEQTAIVVRLLSRAPLPPLNELQDWLTHNGRPLTVRAIDERPAQVIIVRDPAAQPIIDTLVPIFSNPTRARRKPSGPGTPASDDALRSSLEFKLDIDVRLVTPITAPPSHGRVATGNVFPYSDPISLHQGGLLWMLHHHRVTTFPLRFSDAVAWAATELATSGRRRGVILLLGEGAVDGSLHAIDATRRELAALQVPILVWTTASVEPLYPEWNGARSIYDPIVSKRNPELLALALRELEETLERQRVLWLDGHLQPAEIEIAPQARKLVVLEGGS